MSVRSQEHQSQDFQVEQAIADGIRQANEVEPDLEITLEFTNSQQKMLKELTSALALSVEILLESAISYVYFQRKDNQFWKKFEEYIRRHNQEYKDSQQETEKSPKRSTLLTKKLILAAETSYKLEELGMTDRINECVVTGIQLLYEHLIDGQQKSVNE